MKENAFTLEVDQARIARLTFDLPGEKVNKFSSHVMAAFSALLEQLGRRDDIDALILQSAKPGIFIAGADIDELARISSSTDAEAKAREGQAVFSRLEKLPFPTIALIDGACVGGGLECALACSYRVATDSPKTKLGLPEVSLGIIPGWGGTQRLPRLIGLPKSLDLILTGRSVDGKKAFRLGLADALIPHEFIEEAMQGFLAKLSSPDGRSQLERRRQLSFVDWLATKNLVARKLVFKKAKTTLQEKTKGHYPAPEAALELIKRTVGHSLDHGLIEEAKAFSKLCVTHISKNLVQLFYANEGLKKDAGIGDTLHPPAVQSAAVLGAGVMGGGIAWLLSSKDIPVRLKDLNWEAIGTGLAEAQDYYNQLVRRRKMSPSQAKLKMHHISGSIDFSGFRNADIVIEAVVENLAIKRQVLAELEKRIDENAVIATNTSSLSLEDMAVALQRPERFVGMHFFNPVNRMPLVEVIAAAQTSQEALAKVIDLTRRLGKTPIVVNNCSGFLVNRILIPYLNESAYMLQEGTPLSFIDAVVEDFGMPMGPFLLADEVGIDVGLKVASILENAYGDRMRVADIMKAVYEDAHLLGKKQGRGFYLHKGKQHVPNSKEIDQIAQKLRQRLQGPKIELDRERVIDRCMLPMVNEAARCLEEDVVKQPQYIDMAMIMGTGFPPFRGGLLRYADERGITNICRSLDRLQEKHGARFEPSPLLLEMERKNQRFYAHS